MNTLNTYEEKAILPSKMQERYDELCALRDKVNAANAPLELQLDDANKKANAAREAAEAIAMRIDSNRGNERWIALKKEIGVLAKALSGKR